MQGCNSFRWALALPLFVLLLSFPGRAAVVHVNKNATGAVHDGTTWPTAFLTVQAGVNAAKSGDEVWVAASAYREAVTLKPGVGLYGGFTGAETARTQRDIAANVTLLGTTDWSMWVGDSVVTALAGCERDTVLSGFTISRGVGKSNGGNRFYGGGIYCWAASPTIANNTIVGNFIWSQWDGRTWTGGGNGGGIACFDGATPLIIGNVIARNSAIAAIFGGGDGGLGAGVYCNNSSPALLNNTILSNSSASPGGGVTGEGTSAPTLVNNIIAFNGGGVSLSAGVLRNNDVYGNANAALPDYAGIPDPTGTDGNIKADPKVAAIRGDYDYRIQPDSPCVDAGDDAVVVPGATDLEGLARVSGPHVDIGAYESVGIAYPPLASITYVTPTGSDTRSGRSWADAKATISDALRVAADSGEVWVAAGTYAQYFRTAYSVSVYGGFTGTETVRSQRNPAARVTILRPSSSVSIRDASVFDGFTLQSASGNPPVAISAHDAARVTNNIVEAGFWEGIELHGSPVISGNVITGAQGSGVDYGSEGAGETPTIARNVISGCGYGSNPHGGGVSCIRGNYPGTPTVTVRDNLVVGNRGYEAGGVYSDSVTLMLLNNTIAGNTATATVSAGGVYIKSGSATLVNDIVAFNSSGVKAPTATFRNNDVFGNAGFDFGGAVADPTGANGNIKVDPLFVNRLGGDFHLQAGSPCVDAGDDSLIAPGDTDMDGNPRKLGPYVDMGAYEFLTSGYFSLADATLALRVAGGLSGLDQSGLARLNVFPDTLSTNVVDLRDAICIMRKVAGVEPNP